MNNQRPKTLLPVLVITFLLTFATFGLAGPVADDFEPQAVATADCVVGNTNPPGHPPMEDIFLGHEDYAYHIMPMEQCDCSEGGFALETIHHLLDFTTDQIPASFTVRAGLLSANFDAASGCWVPGNIIFISPEVEMLVTDNGLFEVVVPTPNSAYYPIDGHYYLALFYDGMVAGQLVIDDQPMICTEYVNRGNGWEDLHLLAKSGGGKMIVWGDIVCGTPVVDIEKRSFDAIKSLFR